jgi:diacylglycerol kinase family enzyme
LRGRRARRLSRVLEDLAARGLPATAVPTRGPGTAGQIARERISAGADLILSLGGDGTINEVVSGMVHSPVPLGVLPAGTANVLAREIGLGCNLREAAARIPECLPRRIGVGLLHSEGGASSRHFLLMAGVGFDAHIVYRLNLPLKKKLGQVAYWLGAFEQLGRKLDDFEVEAGGRTYRCSFALASRVRNYAGYLTVAREASLLGDEMELVLFEGASAFRYYFKYLVAIMAGTAHRTRGLTFLRTRETAFKAPPGSRVYVQVDGEYAGRLPARVEVVPDALTVLVPPAYCTER